MMVCPQIWHKLHFLVSRVFNLQDQFHTRHLLRDTNSYPIPILQTIHSITAGMVWYTGV